MNENYDDCHHQKTTRTFIYTKSKNNCETFYIQKAGQFPLRFYKQKAIDLTLQDFREIFVVGIYIQNHDTLRYVTLLYTKS